MRQAIQPSAHLNSDNTVTLRIRHWSETFGVEALPRKIALYRGLVERAGGRFAQHHKPTLAALEAVKPAKGGDR